MIFKLLPAHIVSVSSLKLVCTDLSLQKRTNNRCLRGLAENWVWSRPCFKRELLETRIEMNYLVR
jgi:hypothetical protein